MRGLGMNPDEGLVQVFDAARGKALENIQRQRSPPIIPTKGDADCVCLYKRRGMADFRHLFLGRYRYCSSTKPRLRIDLGMKKRVPFTACRIAIWFDFYDCSKNT